MSKNIIYDAVKIGNKGEGMSVWLWNVTHLAGKFEFETKTKFHRNESANPAYYKSFSIDKYTNICRFIPSKNMVAYNRCEPDEANIIIIPYYNGRSIENVLAIANAEELEFWVEGSYPEGENTILQFEVLGVAKRTVKGDNRKVLSDGKPFRKLLSNATKIKLKNPGAFFLKTTYTFPNE